MKHISWILCAIASAAVHAQEINTVRVEYGDTSAVVDSTDIKQSLDITRAEVRYCENGLSRCMLANRRQAYFDDEVDSIRINDTGQSFITYFGEFDRGFGPEEGVVWNQAVTVLERATPGLRSAIMRYGPTLSFHPDEQYKPIYIRDFSSRPTTDLARNSQLTGTQGFVEQQIPDGNSSLETIGDLMRGQGEINNRLFLKESVARNLRGNDNDFPAYWYLNYSEDRNSVWVTYFFLYGFDDKIEGQLDGSLAERASLGLSAKIGDHVMDRESVILQLTRCDAAPADNLPAECERAGPDLWAPVGLTYTGHRPNQPTSFLGCPTDSQGSNPTLDESAVRWSNGRTTVPWENLAKDGVSPAVFVANLSHANKPAPGNYRISVAVALDVVEPAGNFNAEFSRPQFIELDFSDPEHAALSSAIYMVDAPPLKNGDARLPPYDGLYPPSFFASESESNSVFSSCLDAAGDTGDECRRCRDLGVTGQTPDAGDNGQSPTDDALPVEPASVGDPHLITLDGLSYDFQAVGEFVLVESGDGGLQVQGRQTRYPIPNSQVSINTGFAFWISGDAVSVASGTEGEVEVYVNGELFQETGLTVLPSGGMLKNSAGEWGLTWVDGSRARIVSRGRFLDLYLSLAEIYSGLTAGLLGNFDNDSSNDISARDGTNFGTNPTASDLYGTFADGWRVNDETSLFVYSNGESTDTYTNRFFPTAVFGIDDLSEADRRAAEKQCRAANVDLLLQQCILDFGATADPAFLESASAAELLAPEGMKGARTTGLIGPLQQIRTGDLVGRYAGKVYENIFDESEGSPFEVNFSLSPDGELTGRTKYPALGCEGVLDPIQFISNGGNRAILESAERLTTPGSCTDGSLVKIVTLTPTDNPLARVIQLESQLGLGMDFFSFSTPPFGLLQVGVIEKVIQ